MKFNKKLAVAVSGAVLIMAGQFALADSTTDIVDALVSKGVLTEEEGKLITKGAKSQKEAQDKAIKGKLSISGAFDNASLYGDIRVRHETRWSTAQNSPLIDYTRNRERYKITFGVKTETGNWYSDLAFAMGSTGRSDNATIGSAPSVSSAAWSNPTNGDNNKEILYVKRAMVGWKATDWLTLEAGRMANPFYTTEMVWDKDLTMEGADAKFNFKAGDAKIFVTGAAIQYKGDSKIYSGTGAGADTFTNEVVIGQVGIESPLTADLSGKAAVTYYKYGNVAGNFAPTFSGAAALGGNVTGTNNLEIFEIPAELNYKFSSKYGVKLFGDFAYNADADQRRTLAGYDAQKQSGDDRAYMLGLELKSQEGKKEVAGDWVIKGWWQATGMFALDPNAVDSDFFDSKINMKGGIFKGQYAIADNVFFNTAYGHGSKYGNGQTAGVGGDTSYNLKNYDLLQLDLTYKF